MGCLFFVYLTELELRQSLPQLLFNNDQFFRQVVFSSSMHSNFTAPIYINQQIIYSKMLSLYYLSNQFLSKLRTFISQTRILILKIVQTLYDIPFYYFFFVCTALDQPNVSYFAIILLTDCSNITNQQSIMNNLMSPSFSNISSTLPYACSPDQEKQERIATRDSVELTILPQETHQIKNNRLLIFGFSKKQKGKNESQELYCMPSDIHNGHQSLNLQMDTQRIHKVGRKHRNIDQKYVRNGNRERKKGRIFNSSHLKKGFNEFYGNQDNSRVMISSTKRLKEKIDEIIQKSQKENVHQIGYENSSKRYSFDYQNNSDYNHNFTTEYYKKVKPSEKLFKTVQYNKEDHISQNIIRNTPIYQSFICRDETSRYTFEQLHTQHKNPAGKKIKNNTKTMRRIDNNNNDFLNNKKSILLSQFSPQKHGTNKLNQKENNNTKIRMTQQRYYDKQAQTSRFEQKISYRNIDILKQNQKEEENVNVVTHNLFVDFQSSRRCSAFNTPQALRKNKSAVINQVLLSHPINIQSKTKKPENKNTLGKISYVMIALALILLLLQIIR